MIQLFTAFFRFLFLLSTGQIIISKPGSDKRSKGYGDSNKPAITSHPFLKIERKSRTQPQIVRLEVKFRVVRESTVNRFLIPFTGIPFFAGAPGFLSKTFYFNPEDLTYSGFYEWTDRNSVEKYLNAYANRFMTGISIPGSLKCKIYTVPGLPQDSPQVRSTVRQ